LWTACCSAPAAAADQPHPAPRAIIVETKVISPDAEHYHGWPTVVRRKSGELCLVYSGGRQAHVCPFGRLEWMTSRDQGKTWTWPRTLLDSDLDDRDAGILETPKGTLVATTFTSLAYVPTLEKAARGEGPKWISGPTLAAWQAAHARLSDQQRRAQLGSWIVRSADGGITWSSPARCPVNSPHGPIALSDGRLLYVGKELWTAEKRILACESKDDGATWNTLATIPTRRGDDAAAGYHELHAVETRGGKIVAHIRNEKHPNAGETLQTESTDGGRTWSEPHSIGVWGLPSHLLRLADGRLLMTYGYRRAPFGNQARVSTDDGKSWSEPITLSSDGAGGDLGYPSTVQFEDGSLLTVWYESMKEPKGKAVLRQATWRLGE
jgi:Neuraminidase (sialidase)